MRDFALFLAFGAVVRLPHSLCVGDREFGAMLETVQATPAPEEEPDAEMRQFGKASFGGGVH
jgi:hypothetical protein